MKLTTVLGGIIGFAGTFVIIHWYDWHLAAGIFLMIWGNNFKLLKKTK